MRANGNIETQNDAQQALKQSSIAATAPVRLLSVLMADDTRANQRLVLYILAKRGHVVAMAETGKQAVDLLSRQDFDVVLMDLQMPVMDGFQATAAIRKLSDATKANVPIVAVTGRDLAGDREQCMLAGMDGYLSKPINRDELIEAVERWGTNGSGATRN